MTNEILEELYAAKDANARQHGYDLCRMFASMREDMAEMKRAGYKVISAPAPLARTRATSAALPVRHRSAAVSRKPRKVTSSLL
ncbi:MAG: hypothetical protein LBV28_02725 [Puniceicoccales bacterium]|jgi:hypothetical protein|nr:hypothetical protein [Puniceicoccales bacterium]